MIAPLKLSTHFHTHTLTLEIDILIIRLTWDLPVKVTWLTISSQVWLLHFTGPTLSLLFVLPPCSSLYLILPLLFPLFIYYLPSFWAFSFFFVFQINSFVFVYLARFCQKEWYQTSVTKTWNLVHLDGNASRFKLLPL